MPGSATAPRALLTATDRGVSAEAIKVGFGIINFGGVQAQGYTSSARTDVAKAIDAYVDWANRRGGVLGRRIEAVKVEPDLIDATDQRKKCLELTEDKGVFAVMDTAAFLYEESSACITAEHKTLLVTQRPGSSGNVRRGRPYLVSVQNDDNRKMKELVAAAKGAGFFPAKGVWRLGILSDDCSPSLFDSPTDGLKAYLRAAGVREWTEYRGACDVPSAQRTGAQAVLQFRQRDVTHVVVAAGVSNVRSYLTAAGTAGYRPKHFAGDYLNVASGHLAKDFDARSFDGAIGVTQTHAGEGILGKPLPALAQKCSKILTDHGLPPVRYDALDDLGAHIEVLGLCETFMLFLQVATAAGPNLTRSSWAGALPGVGEFRPAYSDLARYTPRGKVTGGDTSKLIQWHGSCRCWKELTPFGPSAG